MESNTGMGTKVQFENYFPGHYSMRDPSRDSNSGSWPVYYGDNNLPNGQYYYGFSPEYDKDVVKQTMLEHETIFKNQVYELHRLYRVQRDLMDEVRRKEQFKRRIPCEMSSSSSPVPSQMHSDNGHKWNASSFPFLNSIGGTPPASHPDNLQSSYAAKGKSVQTSPISFGAHCSPKHSEFSDSRPSKCRRKILDLQLPADAYADTDEVEQFRDAKISDISCQGLDLNSSKSNGLVDLNEPVRDDEMLAVHSVKLSERVVNHSKTQDRDQLTKFPGMQRDGVQNCSHGSTNGALNKLHFEDRRNGPEWFAHSLEPGQSGSSIRSFHAPSQSIQALLEPACRSRPFLDDHIKDGSWRVKPNATMNALDRSYSISSHNNSDPNVVPHFPSPPPFVHPSDLANSWDHSLCSRGKLSSSFSQKSMSVQTNPFFGSAMLSKSPQSSAQSNDLFCNKWNLNNGVDPKRNGFYQGLSSAGFNANHSNSDKVSPSSSKIFKGATCLDLNSTLDANFNAVLSNSMSDVGSTHKLRRSTDKEPKQEDPLAALPWLRGKVNSSGSCLFQKPSGASSSCVVDVKAKKPESVSSRKILGVAVFERPRSADEEIESSGRKAIIDINVACEEAEAGEMAMDEVVVVEKKKTESESVNVRNHIDLNSCITEEEASCFSVKRETGIDLEAPVILEDEEANLLKEEPVMTQHENHVEETEPELAKSAAEAIVTMSSHPHHDCLEEKNGRATVAGPFRLFVDVACACGNDIETELGEKSGRDNGYCSSGPDDFESLTLDLIECSPDEYFSNPSFPVISNLDENGSRVLTTRTRRGPARRGRQRRDFQRDILPGLASLSRHEVTEDLQTFGGLMRATGHPWQSGPNRRNATRKGCSRGRRRSTVESVDPSSPAKLQVRSNIFSSEAGLEDRSLTGWGKTTRRPRRQRCPAGNPPPPPLS